MKTPNLLTQAQVKNINPYLTMTQLIKIYNITGVWDYALPHSFFEKMIELTGFNPVGSMIWYYSAQYRLWGVPFPLVTEALRALKEYSVKSDDKYIQEYLTNHWRI